MKKIIVNNKAVDINDTKTVLSLSAPTPTWAKNVFKLTVIVTSVVTFWIGSTNLVGETYKIEVMTAIKALDLLVLGVSRLFGVETK